MTQAPVLASLKSSFAAEFIDLEQATGIEGAKWEPHQIEFLNNTGRFGADVKSRQIAWSFTVAVDAVVDSIIVPNTPHVIVSLNQDESREKIRYAKSLIGAIDKPARPKIIRETQTEIELENGSRIISHPCRPIRGKARARVYLDEIAHYQRGLDREVYTAALPATSHGDGYIRLGSSPLGATGIFWEIITEAIRRYPGYSGARRYLPWWEMSAFCEEGVVQSRDGIEGMPTRERVFTFGSEPLIAIFENMFLEDFQQEYECSWVDETVSWISWEVILENQDPELLVFRANGVDEGMALIGSIAEAVKSGAIEPALSAGIDIGRVHDKTELIAVGLDEKGGRPVRIMLTLDKVRFGDQSAVLTSMLRTLPFLSVLVDQTGMGVQLAEELSVIPSVEGVTFTNISKELWAVEARSKAQAVLTPLPPDRDLAYQIHSVKKKVSDSSHAIFDVEKALKHHADKFWAWALALWAAENIRPFGGIYV